MTRILYNRFFFSLLDNMSVMVHIVSFFKDIVIKFGL